MKAKAKKTKISAIHKPIIAALTIAWVLQSVLMCLAGVTIAIQYRRLSLQNELIGKQEEVIALYEDREYRLDTNKIEGLINVEREKRDLNPLKVNEDLRLSARLKSADMIANNYWSHDAPDGTEPWVFFHKVGYDYRYAGENLVRGFNTNEKVVQAWLSSPEHRDNMLSPKFEEMGIGVAYQNDKVVGPVPYVTLHLGTRLSSD